MNFFPFSIYFNVNNQIICYITICNYLIVLIVILNKIIIILLSTFKKNLKTLSAI